MKDALVYMWETKVAFAILVILTVLGVAYIGYAQNKGYNCPDEVVIILPGDTLWGIAEAYCTGDPRAVIADMRNQNPHIGDMLFPGDRIQLPQSP